MIEAAREKSMTGRWRSGVSPFKPMPCHLPCAVRTRVMRGRSPRC